VIHDPTVDRTTNGSGLVSSYTLQEIKKLDAGKGEAIPTLQEVIDLIDNRAILIIELKEKETEKSVANLIVKNNLFNNAYVISFYHRLVKIIKDLDSRIKTGVLFVGCPVDTCIANHACADALVMKYDFVDKEFVEIVHEKSLKIFIWNIDDRELLKPYIDMEVDAIGTNDPRIFAQYFK
jgi:glycerophosphoryl diester phosphodiesterase